MKEVSDKDVTFVVVAFVSVVFVVFVMTFVIVVIWGYLPPRARPKKEKKE